MNLNIDLFERPKPKGSAQCPTCGRFSKIVEVQDEGAPMSGEVGATVAIVRCNIHGLGVA